MCHDVLHFCVQCGCANLLFVLARIQIVRHPTVDVCVVQMSDTKIEIGGWKSQWQFSVLNHRLYLIANVPCRIQSFEQLNGRTQITNLHNFEYVGSHDRNALKTCPNVEFWVVLRTSSNSKPNPSRLNSSSILISPTNACHDISMMRSNQPDQVVPYLVSYAFKSSKYKSQYSSSSNMC